MEYIDGGPKLAETATTLDGVDLLAIDTEAAGYHHYSDRVCLVQLSSRRRTYVIDPLAVPGLDPLESLLADPDTEVIIHDAAYDLRLLARDFELEVRGLFDTSVAAQFAGERRIGLSNLLEKHLDLEIEKSYQLADWSKRPLPPEMIEYAAEDTRHLPALRDRLRERLRELGREAWAEEEFRILETDARWDDDEDDEPFRGLKGAGRLQRRGLAALRELYEWRDELARARDRPPGRIVPNRLLVEIAAQRPDSRDALAAVPRMKRRVVERHSAEVLAALERARALPSDRLPAPNERPPRPPRDPAADRRFERLRAVRTESADALGLDRGFLMPRAQIERIARANPDSLEALRAVPGTRDWQIEALGANIMAALRTDRP